MDSPAQQCREMAELFRSVAHPVRICILRELINGTKCVTELQQFLTISQPNVSQHLNALRIAGIINYHEDGKRRCYYLTNPDTTIALLRQAEAFIEQRTPVYY